MLVKTFDISLHSYKMSNGFYNHNKPAKTSKIFLCAWHYPVLGDSVVAAQCNATPPVNMTSLFNTF